MQQVRVVITADLDFGDLLSLTGATGPSVVLLRAREAKPSTSAAALLTALDECDEVLKRGALVVVDRHRLRIRVLPFEDG